MTKLYLYYIDGHLSKIRKWLYVTKDGRINAAIDSSSVPAVALDSKEGGILEAERKSNPCIKRIRSRRVGVECRRRQAWRNGTALGHFTRILQKLILLQQWAYLTPDEAEQAMAIILVAESRVRRLRQDLHHE